MKALALLGARIFDGVQMRDDHAVIVDGARIDAVIPAADIKPDVEKHQIEGLLAPGFIDVQVNGGGGVLFNDTPTVEGIRAIGAAHRRFGTSGFLPTLISDTREKMREALEAVRQGMAEGVPGLIGIHFEGPFLNPARRGVHDAAYIRAAEDEDLSLLTGLGSGRTLVTLSPEKVAPEMIKRLTGAGVIVSAGHTTADVATMAEAVRAGLTGVTHLYNAMPPLRSREPGPVGAALSMTELSVGVIADLIHVAPESLRVAFAAKPDKTMLVTDAMPTVGSNVEEFELQGSPVALKEGRLTNANGTLAGAHLDMASAVRNTVSLGVDMAHALRMSSAVPAAFLGLSGELGRIAPSYRADLVLLDDDLNVKATWIDGVAG